jgi:small subunit ribosomal protein S20
LTLAGDRSIFSGFGRGLCPVAYSTFVEVVVPRIKSAKKRMRQAVGATARNRTQRSQLRSAIKKVRTATAAEAAEVYAAAVKIIDRAGRKNLIHRNAAARQKSRLAKVVAKLGK